MNIAGKVQVDIFHGHNLGVTAARSAAFYTEHGPKGGLTQAEHRLFTHGVQGVRQANTGGGFALASRGGADGGHQDQLAVWAVTVDQLVVDLGFITAIRNQILVRKAQFFSYFGNGQHFGCLCNYNVAQHVAFLRLQKIKGCVHHTSVYAAQTVGLMQGIARFPGGHAHQIPSVSGPALLLLYHTGTQFVKPIFGGYKRVEKSRPCSTQAAEKGVLPMYTDFGYIGSDGIEYATLDEAIEAGAA